MALNPQQIKELLEMLSLTREQELTCDECAEKLAEFAEYHLQGMSPVEGLEAVEHHLGLCGYCREELQALLEAMSD